MMTLNLKIFGISLVAVVAAAFFGASGVLANSTAHTGGHFTQDSGGIATLHGDDEALHQAHLYLWGPFVACDDTYTGKITAATVTSVTIVPEYNECTTENELSFWTMNGCVYTFTVRDTDASTKKSPLHLKCPTGKKVEILWPGTCTTTFGEQTITEAVTYTSVTVNGKHALTVDLDATGMAYEKHGLCVLFGPAGTGPFASASLTGSATLTARNELGEPVNLTATGRNGH